jgi:hypothetical protein
VSELEFHISPVRRSSRPQVTVGKHGTRSSSRRASAASWLSRLGLATASDASGMVPSCHRRTS